MSLRLDAGHADYPSFAPPPVGSDDADVLDDGTERFASDLPGSLILPESYEPRYAYPLVIWLHGAGSSEREFEQLMPRISQRNHIGLSLRGYLPGPNGVGYRWGRDDRLRRRFERDLRETLHQVEGSCRVHPHRIYLAGVDDGAETAMRLLWHHPRRFAGAITLRGRFPKLPTPLVNHPQYAGRRLLMATTDENPGRGLAELTRSARLFHTAGMSVSTRVYPIAEGLPSGLLGEIDRWILAAISTSVSA